MISIVVVFEILVGNKGRWRSIAIVWYTSPSEILWWFIYPNPRIWNRNSSRTEFMTARYDAGMSIIQNRIFGLSALSSVYRLYKPGLINEWLELTQNESSSRRCWRRKRTLIILNDVSMNIFEANHSGRRSSPIRINFGLPNLDISHEHIAHLWRLRRVTQDINRNYLGLGRIRSGCEVVRIRDNGEAWIDFVSNVSIPALCFLRAAYWRVIRPLLCPVSSKLNFNYTVSMRLLLSRLYV